MVVVAAVVGVVVSRGVRARRLVARVVLAVVLALSVLLAPGLERPAGGPVPVPAACTMADPGPPASDAVNQALDRVGAASVPASFVFAVDTSRSVGRYYDSIRDALRRFLRALGPEDQVALVAFAGRAESTLPLAPREDRIDEIVDALPAADGDNTDIGAALAQSLGELQNAPDGQPGAVVLFTDGDNKPEPGSRYRDVNGPEWAALTTDAADLGRDHPLQAYAVPLTADLSGVNLMCQVFPGAQRRPVGAKPERLSLFLQRARTTARLQGAGTLLGVDRGKGVVVEWDLPAGADMDLAAASATLRLRNTAPHLPVVLDDVRLAPDGDLDGVTADLPGRVELGPGETRELPVRLTWPRQARSSLWPGRGGYATDLAVAAAVSAPDAVVLAEAGLPGGPVALEAAPTGSGVLRGTGETAFLWWVWLLVLLAGAVAVLAGRWLRPPLAGALRIECMPRPGEERGGNQWTDIGEVPLHGRSRSAPVVPGLLKVRVRSWRDPWTRRERMRVTLSRSDRGKVTRIMDAGSHWLILGYGVRHDLRPDHDRTTVPTPWGPPHR